MAVTSFTAHVLQRAPEVVEAGEVDADQARADTFGFDEALCDVAADRFSADFQIVSGFLNGARNFGV